MRLRHLDAAILLAVVCVLGALGCANTDFKSGCADEPTTCDDYVPLDDGSTADSRNDTGPFDAKRDAEFDVETETTDAAVDTTDSRTDSDAIADDSDAPTKDGEVGGDACVPTGSCGSRVCGAVSDGCGATLTCGACTSPAACTSSGTCTTTTGWSPLPAPPAGLVGRRYATVVWTGTEMIIFGGLSVTSAVTDQGAAYNPTTGIWRMLPSPPGGGRSNHVAVWSGSQMLVWGGTNAAGSDELNTGVAYDPTTNAWSTISAAPIIKRTNAAAVWCPDTSEMIVWGGGSFFAVVPADGAAYKPSAGTWRTLAAGPIAARSGHTMVWDGLSATIWGGLGASDGARYYPVGDSWPGTISTAPSGVDSRTLSVAYLSSRLIVWGGSPSTDPTDVGASFRSGAWTLMPSPASVLPTSQRAGAAHWDGNGKFWIWSGQTGTSTKTFPSSGASYDPATNTWAAMSNTGAPAGRFGAYAVWTGTSAVVWGGATGASPSTLLTDGATYVP